MKPAALLCFLGSVTGVPAVVTYPPAAAQTVSFSARLRGTAEPGHGAPQGRGTATITLDPARRRLCYTIRVTGITLPARGAEIHLRTTKTRGRLIVKLHPPGRNGLSDGCISLALAEIKAMVAHPAYYYLNIYTVDFPRGAVRGTF